MKYLALLILALIALSACTQVTIEPDTRTILPSSSTELAYFETDEELLEYLKENRGTSNYAVRSFAMDMAESAPSALAATGDGADEFSGTNVQVQGVDEADIVKTDGKHLYVLAGETLVILDAYPAESAEILSETNIKGRPQNLFLDENKIIVFSQDSEQRLTWPEYSILPEPRYTDVTKAYIYDATNKAALELVDTIEITGSYKESRLLDGYIYTIVNEYTWFRDDMIATPMVRSDEQLIEPRIYYFDNPEDNYQYTTVTSFSTDGQAINAESYLTGYANTVYMSTEALYIAFQRHEPWRTEQRSQFEEVVLPVLPDELQERIERLDDWNEIARELEDYFNEADEDALEQLMEDIDEAISEYEEARARERSRTEIHKISVRNGMLDYQANGEVPGTLLNQFSLDEHQGNLRVATTVNAWTRNDRIQYNNVYVLDEDLFLIGELEGIAEDERIYSTRFMGDRLYMVTFRDVDPFFVIDLANPEEPAVLGELKIPGWSNYLHPYDDNHIIGIGKQTKENEWGGAQVLGVKMSLFDVSDVSNPREVDTYEIGTTGSDSEVLRDHKAFLFDKERELLVLPVREVTDRGSRNVWQGAYVFRIDENGFEFRDRIRHYDGDRENYWSWWGSTSSVRRALYMDDVLYTVSLEQVRMHDLDTLDSIKSIELPYDAPDYGWPEPRPMPEPILW